MKNIAIQTQRNILNNDILIVIQYQRLPYYVHFLKIKYQQRKVKEVLKFMCTSKAACKSQSLYKNDVYLFTQNTTYLTYYCELWPISEPRNFVSLFQLLVVKYLINSVNIKIKSLIVNSEPTLEDRRMLGYGNNSCKYSFLRNFKSLSWNGSSQKEYLTFYDSVPKGQNALLLRQ